MDGWDVFAVVFLALYFLPAVIHLIWSGEGVFGNLLFAALCLVANWTIVGWFGTMAMALDELETKPEAGSPPEP